MELLHPVDTPCRHGILYIYAQSHRHGWTYQGLYLRSHGPRRGRGQSAPAQDRFEPLTCRSTVEHANHRTTGPQVGGSVIPRVLNRGLLYIGGYTNETGTHPSLIYLFIYLLFIYFLLFIYLFIGGSSLDEFI